MSEHSPAALDADPVLRQVRDAARQIRRPIGNHVRQGHEVVRPALPTRR